MAKRSSKTAPVGALGCDVVRDRRCDKRRSTLEMRIGAGGSDGVAVMACPAVLSGYLLALLEGQEGGQVPSALSKAAEIAASHGHTKTCSKVSRKSRQFLSVVPSTSLMRAHGFSPKVAELFPPETYFVGPDASALGASLFRAVPRAIEDG